MTVLLCDVGRQGHLNLTFTSRNGRTAIADAYCEVPFKITRLHESDSLGIPHLIVMHCTAGIFGGDALDCSIHVEAGARVLITQQSALKVHPSAAGRAIQQSRIRVEPGGELHIYNEPLIPFAGAHLSQQTRIDLDIGSRLYFWESVMAGRVGSGEVWQFDELSSETRLSANDKLLYLDRFRLVPKKDRLTGAWAMGGARYLATGLCFDDRADHFVERLHAVMPDAGVDSPADGLAVVRLATSDGLSFHRAVAAFKSVTLT